MVDQEAIEMTDMHESSTRPSIESTESEISKAFEEIDEQARMLPDYEDLEIPFENSQLTLTRKFKKSWVLGVLIMMLVGYTALLLSYRGVNAHGRKNYSLVNSTVSSSSASAIQSAVLDIPPSTDQSSSLQSTTIEVPLVTLTEIEIRPPRDPLPTKVFKQAIITDEPSFLTGRVSKENDEGTYIVHDNEKIVLKKASDLKFQLTLYESSFFNYGNIDIVIEKVVSNSDGSKLLVGSQHTPQFRYSAEAFWYLYDVTNKEFTQVTGDSKDVKLQHCSWSPSSSHVTFVQNHDLYLFDVNEKVSKRLTFDGSNDVFNGKADWVYEEEVLASDSALWWNDYGTKLAFLRTDDTQVETLSLERFSHGVFPTVENIKYPKPGESNPKLTMFIYDVTTDKLEAIERSDTKFDEEWICYGAQWIGDTLVVRESDRESKVLDYRVLNNDGSKVRYTIDSNKYGGWIENFGEMLIISKNGTSGRAQDGFVDIVESNGYNHIGFFTLDSMKPKMLTSGDWEVLSVDFFDQEEELLYFSANRQSHFESQIYAIHIPSGEMFAISDIDKPGYYAGIYSSSGRHIILIFEGPGLTRTSIMDTMEQSSPKKERGLDLTGSRSHYHTITLSDGETVDLIEMLPENFDPSKKHPLLVNVYGGPGFRKLDTRFHVGFEDSISQNLNAIVLFIDPRGTGGQGWKYRSYSKRNIGHWEPRDVTEVTKLWIQSRRYIDDEKTAIWGWSYGGFTTLKTLEYDKGNVFKYGMAVAPVTNWMMYDSIYTERYMDKPEDNKEGYGASRIVDPEGLKGVRRFAIMHGTGDDNVHIQNTFKLLDSFNLHNVINFDLMVFPDSNHNINFHNSYDVLMERLTIWLTEKFTM
jgi:dipeptidyl aminopeptidase/acylaminoacyl peptidase